MNMLLWVFGLIVEGKIGWWRALAAFMGVAEDPYEVAQEDW